MAENYLYYGDNLDILRRHVADESVDLICLDPPFKSNQNYNVLFAEHKGTLNEQASWDYNWRCQSVVVCSVATHVQRIR